MQQVGRHSRAGCVSTPLYDRFVSRAVTVTLASGVSLSYVEQGAATGPVALLLPGPTDSWRSYEPVLENLPAWMRAIAVSQRGHGDSDKPEGGYRVGDFADDVVGFLDALEIERAVLVGHSGSCLVARRVALDHSERVAGLVLEAAPTNLRNDAARDFVGSVVMRLTDPIDPDVVRSFLADTSSAQVAPEQVDLLVAEVLKVPARVWHTMFSSLLDYDDTDDLSRIDAPSLLIWGEDDPIVSRSMQETLVDRMPNAALVTYPSVGHTPRWDDPRRFSADLTAFVDRLRGPSAPTPPVPSGS